MKFELYEDTVIYAGEYFGAILEPKDGKWYSFSYFTDGNIQVNDTPHDTPKEGYEFAKEYFS